MCAGDPPKSPQNLRWKISELPAEVFRKIPSFFRELKTARLKGKEKEKTRNEIPLRAGNRRRACG